AWAGELLRDPRRLALVTVAAAVITVNWGVYIWAVNAGHVVEASLGYFINPLVSIALGVLLLGERLRPAQWVAVGTGVASVLVLAVGYGKPPWISLVL
ncbi:EamA family transporter, partial [Streptomyces sp. SID11233]|nr:EamA family transporter [Streptomyces sp. SID11233]